MLHALMSVEAKFRSRLVSTIGLAVSQIRWASCGSFPKSADSRYIHPQIL